MSGMPFKPVELWVSDCPHPQVQPVSNYVERAVSFTPNYAYAAEPHRQAYAAEPHRQAYAAEPHRQAYAAEPHRQAYAAEPHRQAYAAELHSRAPAIMSNVTVRIELSSDICGQSHCESCEDIMMYHDQLVRRTVVEMTPITNKNVHYTYILLGGFEAYIVYFACGPEGNVLLTHITVRCDYCHLWYNLLLEETPIHIKQALDDMRIHQSKCHHKTIPIRNAALIMAFAQHPHMGLDSPAAYLTSFNLRMIICLLKEQ